MFERYTDQARRVVAWAQVEARAGHRRRVGTKHILLGLIHEDGSLAARALESAGIRLADLGRWAGEGGEQPSTRTRDLPYTPRARTVLEQSTRWALRLGDNHIGTKHILLALAEERDGSAAVALSQAGADPKDIRQQVMLAVHTQHPG